jgi:curved DNA-binding protein CbpA
MDLETALAIFNLKQIDDLDLPSLKSKYRMLAKEKHPDSGQGSNQDFVRLREAFLYLKDRVKLKNTPSNSVTDLKALSKEEILAKYYKDTQALELRLESFNETLLEQTEIVDNIRKKVQIIVDEFERKKEILKKQLEKEIFELERKYSINFFKKMLFFLPRMNEKEFWRMYEKQVEKYAKKHTEMDMQFLREMLNAYGNGLNDISEIIEKIEETIENN